MKPVSRSPELAEGKRVREVRIKHGEKQASDTSAERMIKAMKELVIQKAAVNRLLFLSSSSVSLLSAKGVDKQ